MARRAAASASAREPRLAETVVYVDGTKRSAAIVTEIVGLVVHLKVFPSRAVAHDERHVPHRKDIVQGEDRYWTHVDEE